MLNTNTAFNIEYNMVMFNVNARMNRSVHVRLDSSDVRY